MSYPRDVDEIPSAEMSNELLDRMRSIRLGLCPYCHQPFKAHGCKMRGREWEMYGEEIAAHVDIAAEKARYQKVLDELRGVH